MGDIMFHGIGFVLLGFLGAASAPSNVFYLECHGTDISANAPVRTYFLKIDPDAHRVGYVTSVQDLKEAPMDGVVSTFNDDLIQWAGTFQYALDRHTNVLTETIFGDRHYQCKPTTPTPGD
jgi:hypothetical protein